MDKAKPSTKVRENAAQDRDLQMKPLNPAHRNITGPSPSATPKSHGNDGRGKGTGVTNDGRGR